MGHTARHTERLVEFIVPTLRKMREGWGTQTVFSCRSNSCRINRDGCNTRTLCELMKIIESNRVRITQHGLHWEALDEDISIAGLLAGLGDLGRGGKSFAA